MSNENSEEQKKLEELKERIAKRLYDARTNNGKSFTQEQIADKIGLTQKTYGKYEQAEILPPINRLIKLSEAFGVSIDRLVKEEENSVLDEFYLILPKLSEKDQQQLLKIAKTFLVDENTL